MDNVALRKGKAYQWFGLAGVLFSAGYLAMAVELPFGELSQPGAGIFPVVAGVILLAASLITIWEGRKLDPDSQLALPSGADARRLLGLVAALLGFLVALPLLGLLISSTLFCILLMRIISDLGWPRIAVYSVLICSALYGVFVFLLKVPMPRGLLAY
jgi:putative tricarboxylic transport membrane protein